MLVYADDGIILHNHDHCVKSYYIWISLYVYYVYTNIPVCILCIYEYPCMYIMYIRISLYVYYVYTNIPVCI